MKDEELRKIFWSPERAGNWKNQIKRRHDDRKPKENTHRRAREDQQIEETNRNNKMKSIERQNKQVIKTKTKKKTIEKKRNAAETKTKARKTKNARKDKKKRKPKTYTHSNILEEIWKSKDNNKVRQSKHKEKKIIRRASQPTMPKRDHETTFCENDSSNAASNFK